MARPRKKKRTQAQPSTTHGATPKPGIADPKTLVVRMGAGDIGPSVSQLVKDVRLMMEPGTASRLKERRSNKLRDYTSMAGPLGVSHLLLFSRSDAGNTNLRVALTPRGPTLHFRVERYALAKDIKKAQMAPQGHAQAFSTPPLLVMNNFTSASGTDTAQNGIPKHLENLTTTIFQSLFPPISPQVTPLTSIRRVLLLNRELPKNDAAMADDTYILNVRHYAITTKHTGLSRGVRRLNKAEKLMKQPSRPKKKLPDLSRLGDVADYLLDPAAVNPGYSSGSESEAGTDAEIEVMRSASRRVLNKEQLANKRAKEGKIADGQSNTTERRVVKLVELGPRMRLRLTKVEEGLCEGKIMYHEYLNKSPDEIKAMDAAWAKRRAELKERKRVQRANVDKKRAEFEKNKPKSSTGDDVEPQSVDEWDSDPEDDDL